MKSTIFVVLGILIFSSPSFALDCAKNYKPTYCESKDKAPKAARKAPRPQYVPEKRQEGNPFFIIPSFFGALFGSATEIVDKGSQTVVQGVKKTLTIPRDILYTGEDSFLK